jgi:TRAP-type C4-dicarboxylate transport system substrate-binding protein
MFRILMTAGLASLLASAATAAQKVEWNHSTWGNSRAFTKGFEAVAKFVEEKSGGNFTIKIHYGETISPSRENLDGLQLGAFEQANICTSYHPGKNPVGTVLDLPFLPLRDWDTLVAVQDVFQRHPLWQNEMARWNAVPLFAGVLPQYEFMGVGKPPTELDDWKGMRVRALGGIGDAMRQLGAVPTSVPAPEVYTSLERGVVQAASFPYAYSFGSFRVHEIGAWFTEGMAPGTLHCPILVNGPALKALPAEYRKMLMDSVPVAYETLKQAYVDADAKWIPIYKERMKLVIYSPEQNKQFQELAARPVWNDWVAQHKGKFDSQAVLDFILAEAAKHVNK